MCGLDASGKTTILYKMKLGDVSTIMPTIGFNIEKAKYKNVDFTVWDVGGRGQIRPLWRHYFQDANALVFVVDSNDRERLEEASQELSRMMKEDELANAVLLVFANKQDLPNALSIQEVTARLRLNELPASRRWSIQSCCATSGDGLYEGFDTLSNSISAQLASLRSTPVPAVVVPPSIAEIKSVYEVAATDKKAVAVTSPQPELQIDTTKTANAAV